MFLLDEDTSPAEDKVFFMDPGFSLPERSDLLELDLDEDKTIISPERRNKPGRTQIIRRKIQKNCCSLSL